ncbi:MAG: DNA/RNA non-specific endonuclease [Bdellovibrionaceae bacterium]|nr:DNA/RNA non-specific endonuclease [Pseudobdellovibrionaceae bacterium]
MKKIVCCFLILFIPFDSSALSKEYFNIYSDHWWGALPLKNNKDKILIHDIFIISFDTDKKFPTWLMYKLSPSLVWGKLKAERKYVADPLLFPNSSLTYKDWRGASNCDGKLKEGYDKAHLAPLGSFKSSVSAYEAQYLTNLVPQRRNLNQGPWRVLEEKVRAFVKKGHEVKILTGTLYRKKTPPCWKAVQGKISQIPSHYWKLVTFKKNNKITVCSVLMPQQIRSKTENPFRYKLSLKKIEEELGFKLILSDKNFLKGSCEFLY